MTQKTCKTCKKVIKNNPRIKLDITTMTIDDKKIFCSEKCFIDFIKRKYKKRIWS